MANTYPIPGATVVAFGNNSGLEYGKGHIYESPVTNAMIAVESMELRDDVVRGLGYAAGHGRNGDTDVEIVVVPPKSE